MALSVNELKELIDHCRAKGVRSLVTEGVTLELDRAIAAAPPPAPAPEFDPDLFAHEGA